MTNERGATVRTVRAADLLVQTLESVGISHVFALSGNQIMPIFDACIGSRLQLIHVRHEATTVHMADAWARLSGQVGVALVTAGPGFANALSALYTALTAESPMVLLSGQSPLSQAGQGAFQEMPQADMAKGVCKAAWTVTDADQIGSELTQAIEIATSGRPGPVYLSLPFDVLDAEIANASTTLWQAREHPITEAQADAILQHLSDAARPLILTGPALMHNTAADLMAELQVKLQIPVIGMQSPRGSRDPSLGDLTSVLTQADTVLLLGKSIDFTLGFGSVFAPTCRFLQIDPEQQIVDRSQQNIDAGQRFLLTAQAEAYPSARRLLGRSKKQKQYQPWLTEVQTALDYRPADWQSINSTTGPLHPVEVCRTVATVLQPQNDDHDNVIFVADGGEFSQWAQACLSGYTRIINGPAGAIGSALPAAIAAKLARPNATVIALLGDGTFGFHMSEFDTAIRYQVPFVAIVGNDACWNAEYQIQRRLYGEDRVLGCELLPTRYDQVVTALGGYGEYVSQADQLSGALQRALASEQPACVNVSLQRHPAPALTR